MSCNPYLEEELVANSAKDKFGLKTKLGILLFILFLLSIAIVLGSFYA